MTIDKKINVYFLENQYTYWTWHDVLLELVLYLKETYDANIIHQRGDFLYHEKYNNHKISDCELIIEDLTNDTVKAVSFSETNTGIIDNIFLNRNNQNDILLLTQFHNWFPKDFSADAFPFQLKPTTFFTYSPIINYDYWYRQRKFSLINNGYSSLRDKLFCMTSTGRDDVPRLSDRGILEPNPNTSSGLSIERYLDDAIKYKVGFAVGGNAEVCHREIEYMAIGLPTLHLEYMTQLEPKLIPDYHYISIPRDEFAWDNNFDRMGGDQYVDAYIKRFNEVKDDYEFLNFIAENAREYYENNCSPQNRMKYILSALEI